MNKLIKVVGYNINIKKSVAFLYTSNEIYKKKMKKTIPFIITTKKITNGAGTIR